MDDDNEEETKNTNNKQAGFYRVMALSVLNQMSCKGKEESAEMNAGSILSELKRNVEQIEHL